jgi:hypothetical protein
MFAFTQLVHFGFLSHFTLRRRQVTHDRGFRLELPFGDCWLADDVLWTLLSALWILGERRIPNESSVIASAYRSSSQRKVFAVPAQLDSKSIKLKEETNDIPNYRSASVIRKAA